MREFNKKYSGSTSANQIHVSSYKPAIMSEDTPASSWPGHQQAKWDREHVEVMEPLGECFN